jgi:hypothetical protein
MLLQSEQLNDGKIDFAVHFRVQDADRFRGHREREIQRFLRPQEITIVGTSEGFSVKKVVPVRLIQRLD